jgi:hypothetical protein
LKDLGIDGKIILKCIKGWEGVDWFHLTKEDQWQVLLSTNESFGSIKGGEFFDYLRVLSALQEGLCSVELVHCYTTLEHNNDPFIYLAHDGN